MSTEALVPDQLFDGAALRRDRAVVLRGAHIDAVVEAGSLSDELPVTRLSGLLTPGLIDLQVNGGGGVLFGDDPAPESWRRALRAHRREGTTGLLPTLISPTRTAVEENLEVLRKSLQSGDPVDLGVLGIHFEGPHLNPERCGAHAPARIQTSVVS